MRSKKSRRAETIALRKISNFFVDVVRSHTSIGLPCPNFLKIWSKAHKNGLFTDKTVLELTSIFHRKIIPRLDSFVKNEQVRSFILLNLSKFDGSAVEKGNSSCDEPAEECIPKLLPIYDDVIVIESPDDDLKMTNENLAPPVLDVQIGPAIEKSGFSAKESDRNGKSACVTDGKTESETELSKKLKERLKNRENHRNWRIKNRDYYANYFSVPERRERTYLLHKIWRKNNPDYYKNWLAAKRRLNNKQKRNERKIPEKLASPSLKKTLDHQHHHEPQQQHRKQFESEAEKSAAVKRKVNTDRMSIDVEVNSKTTTPVQQHKNKISMLKQRLTLKRNENAARLKHIEQMTSELTSMQQATIACQKITGQLMSGNVDMEHELVALQCEISKYERIAQYGMPISTHILYRP